MTTRATQVHPKTGKVIRRIEILARYKDGTVHVRALNGPLKGATYTVAMRQIRMTP